MPKSAVAGPYRVVSNPTTPSVRERPVARARAIVFGRYSSFRIAASTRSRVSGRTCGLPLSTPGTVWWDTSASFATSAITAGRRFLVVWPPFSASIGLILAGDVSVNTRGLRERGDQGLTFQL